MPEESNTCTSCDGSGKMPDFCTECMGTGALPVKGINAYFKTQFADILDKCNDILDKCNDIFEKVNTP
jgi:DnaJ-class molecular chaperone